MRKEHGGQLGPDTHMSAAADDRESLSRLATLGVGALAVDSIPEISGHNGPDTHEDRAADDDGGLMLDGVRGSLAPVVPLLKGLQRRRRFAIKMQMRLDLSTMAYLRMVMGWSPVLPDKEREAISKRASSAYAACAKDKDSELDAEDRMVVTLALSAREPFDKLRKSVEKEMEKAARTLPGYAWVKSIKGFGDKTFGIIIAETGDLGGYANPGKVWKRLGLAPKDTYQAAENGARMIPKQRRAEVWACLGDSVLKQQWAAEKEDAPAHGTGHYGELYGAKKAEYIERGWTVGHAHKAAHRYMEKRLLRDLWRAWRAETTAEVAPIESMSPLANLD